MEQKQDAGPPRGDADIREEERSNTNAAESAASDAPKTDGEMRAERERVQELQAKVEDFPTEDARIDGNSMALGSDAPREENATSPDIRTAPEDNSATQDLTPGATGAAAAAAAQALISDPVTAMGTQRASEGMETITPVPPSLAQPITSTVVPPLQDDRQAGPSAASGQQLGAEMEQREPSPPREIAQPADTQLASSPAQTPASEPTERSNQQLEVQPDETEHPPIPIEHARQPYSSQPSNARFEPAGTGSEGGGARQGQAGVGSGVAAAARGMPMCTYGIMSVAFAPEGLMSLILPYAVSGRPQFVETDSKSRRTTPSASI